MSQTTAIDLPLDEIRQYCATQPIARLSLLGPDFEGWLRPDTDVGMLVEYAPEAGISYFDMARQEMELGALIGAGIDLRTPPEVHRLVDLDNGDGMKLVYAQNQSN